MCVCTFFGHKDCPDSIKQRIREILIEMIVNHNVNMFYVGNQGRFDAIVRSALRRLMKKYPQIHYAVVLAYMPQGESIDLSDTMLPEGIESIRPRYAISWRNNWILQQSGYVVTYITHSWGGAAQYAAKAVCQGKTVCICGK